MAMEFAFYVSVALVTVIAVVVHRFLKERYSLFERLNIPGPKPTWIIGNVLAFRNKNPLEVFRYWYEVHGKEYGFYEGLRASVVISDPELAKEILVKQFDKINMRAPYKPFLYFPSNLSLTELSGEIWKQNRTILFKALNLRSSMNMVCCKIQKRVAVLMEDLEKQSTQYPSGFNISRSVQRFAVTSAISITTDMTEKETEKNCHVFEAYQEACKRSMSRHSTAGLAKLFPVLQPVLKLFDVQHKRAHERLIHYLKTFVLFDSSKSEMNNNDNPGEPQNLINYLKASTKPILSLDEILAQALMIITEAFDTSANAILFMLYELALHPDLQDRLYKEITERTNQTKDGIMNSVDLQGLKYFDMFLYETLRLHPVAPGMARICTCDSIIKGAKFKKNMTVRVLTSTINQCGRYFPNPKKFDPERFAAAEKQDRHSCTFLPFGVGPRMCPGMKIATVEIKIAVAAILKKFSLHKNSDTEIQKSMNYKSSIQNIAVSLKTRAHKSCATY